MGGIAGAVASSVEEDSGFVDCGLRVPRGDMFVGPLFTKSLIRSGVFAGVTFSMIWKEGRRRTDVLWSEWLGTGMLEAESMRR